MGYLTIIWDLDEDPNGNAQHISEHDLTKEEVEERYSRPRRTRDQSLIWSTDRFRHDIHGTLYCRRLRRD